MSPVSPSSVFGWRTASHKVSIRIAGVAWLLWLAIGPASLLAATTDAPQDLGIRAGRPTRPVSLRDRLLTGLQARLPQEIQFIDHIVAQVETGKLPQRLVDQTFFWARARATHPRAHRRKRRPIIYFRPALLARTEKLGIEL